MLSAVFCTLTVAGLLGWPSTTKATQSAAAVPPPATSSSAPKGLSIPAAEPAPAPKSFAVNSAGDVIDVARLVLETTRDQTASVTSLIERAATVIVVFFTLLGATATAFGWHKFNDMKVAADQVLDKYREDMAAAQKNAAALHAEFEDSLEKATIATRKEMNGQMELMAARGELDQAINGKFDPQLANRMLNNAVKRISSVLEGQEMSTKAKIRGLADLAYARKRLGDVETAFETVHKAADLARADAPSMFPLLAYNAACYACLLNQAEAIQWLKDAIAADSQYKENAAKDSDFASINLRPGRGVSPCLR